MNQFLILLMLVCGLFSNSGGFLAQSNSAITSKNPRVEQPQSSATSPTNQSETNVELFRAILKNNAKGDIDAVKAALKKGADPNSVTDLDKIGKNLTPLVLAVGN